MTYDKPSIEYVLTLSCPDRPGIVATVSTELYNAKANIIESQQHNDSSGRFFMRVVFSLGNDSEIYAWLNSRLEAQAQHYSMTWLLHNRAKKRKVLIMVSKFDHCLVDLLYRWRIGELNIEPTAIVSNYPKENYSHIDLQGIPFFFLPVDANNKTKQENEVWNIFRNTHTELIILARYMQILSADFIKKIPGQCINIHHSFLPGFKGAKAYHQAFARGVKLIGATAHYVTKELDEGPIIDQDVERVSHRDRPEDLVRKGRDIERRVLAKSIRYYSEDRVILNGNKTVVFTD